MHSGHFRVKRGHSLTDVQTESLVHWPNFRQTVGLSIAMETNCTLLLASLFLYLYEKEFLDRIIKEAKRMLARKFKLSSSFPISTQKDL